jgi:hypothetical protein
MPISSSIVFQDDMTNQLLLELQSIGVIWGSQCIIYVERAKFKKSEAQLIGWRLSSCQQVIVP